MLVSGKGLERKRGFQCSAEFYEKVLQLDLQCTFTVQGLAIATAKDFLNLLGGLSRGAGVWKSEGVTE